MAPHSSTLAWKILWMEEPGGLQSMGSLESDTTEWLHFHFSLSCIGEGNGNPLQCSCLENPRDGGAWWAAVYGIAQSRTRLKWQQQQQQTKLANICMYINPYIHTISIFISASICVFMCVYYVHIYHRTTYRLLVYVDIYIALLYIFYNMYNIMLIDIDIDICKVRMSPFWYLQLESSTTKFILAFHPPPQTNHPLLSLTVKTLSHYNLFTYCSTLVYRLSSIRIVNLWRSYQL